MVMIYGDEKYVTATSSKNCKTPLGPPQEMILNNNIDDDQKRKF